MTIVSIKFNSHVFFLATMMMIVEGRDDNDESPKDNKTKTKTKQKCYES